MHGIKRTLQDVGGGGAVNHGPAALATQIRLADQHPVDGGGRETLIPERERQVDLDQQVARELAHALALRPLRAVHAHRQADHDTADLVLPAQHGEARKIVSIALAFEHTVGGGHGAGLVGNGESNPLRTDVEPEQAPARRHNGAQFRNADDGHGCDRLLHEVSRSLIAGAASREQRPGAGSTTGDAT